MVGVRVGRVLEDLFEEEGVLADALDGFDEEGFEAEVARLGHIIHQVL